MNKLAFLFLFFSIIASLHVQAQDEDAVIYIYQQIDKDFYYLSAVDGGGDELVTRKLQGTPGMNEEFLMEFHGADKRGFGLFALKTTDNFYVEVSEDALLMASEKEFDEKKHTFEMKVISPGKEVMDFELIMRKGVEGDSKSYLTFADPTYGFELGQAEEAYMPRHKARLVKDGFNLLKFGPVKYELDLVFNKRSKACEELDWLGNLSLEDPNNSRNVVNLDMEQAGTNWLFANTVAYPAKVSAVEIRLLDGKKCKIEAVQINWGDKSQTWEINKNLKAGEGLMLDWKGEFEKISN